MLSLDYFIEPKEYADTDKQVHKGKKILAKNDGEIVGKTGYVEWNKGYYAFGGNTARLMRSDSELFHIYVNAPMRKQGVGQSLMEKTIDELDAEGYEQLIILGATKTAKGFYDRVFEKLELTGRISSFYPTMRIFDFVDHCQPDYDYTVKL